MIASCACLLLVLQVPKKDSPAKPAPPVRPLTFQLTIHPAAIEQPAFRYLLAPLPSERIAGNAVLYLYRAALYSVVLGEDAKEIYRKLYEYSGDLPLAELPIAEAKKLTARFKPVLRELERAALCRECDWAFDHLIGAQGIDSLLNEVQRFRVIAVLLKLEVRLAVREKRYADAVRILRIGFEMSRRITEGPTYIQGLVGIAINSVMLGCAWDLMQQPDAPNLYWAFAGLPSPYLNARQGLMSEMKTFDYVLPSLAELEKTPLSPDAAMELYRDVERRYRRALGDENGGPTKEHAPNLPPAALLKEAARQRLLSFGCPREQIEKFPAEQLVLLETVQSFRRIRDDLFQCVQLPYHEGVDRFREVQQRIKEAEKTENILLRVFLMLLPAAEKTAHAYARSERQLALTRTIEALRAHLAATGKLPDRLSDVKVLLIPPDPASGKPFEYRRTSETTAEILAPAPPSMANDAVYALRFDLTVGR